MTHSFEIAVPLLLVEIHGIVEHGVLPYRKDDTEAVFTVTPEIQDIPHAVMKLMGYLDTFGCVPEDVDVRLPVAAPHEVS